MYLVITTYEGVASGKCQGVSLREDEGKRRWEGGGGKEGGITYLYKK